MRETPARHGLPTQLQHDRPSSKRHVNRRALIVTDAVVAALLWLLGIANFVLDQRAGILAGISAMVLGACAATTTCLLIASGRWRKDQQRQTRDIGMKNL